MLPTSDFFNHELFDMRPPSVLLTVSLSQRKIWLRKRTETVYCFYISWSFYGDRIQ